MAKHPKLRTSTDAAHDIDLIEQERGAAVMKIAELESSWQNVLLTGDDAAAERHQAERATSAGDRALRSTASAIARRADRAARRGSF